MPRIVVETGGTDWVTPVATLVAVLVGGLLSWIAQSRLAKSRAEFERDAEAAATEQQLAIEARAAARVLRSDLSGAARRLDSIVERKQWLPFHTLAPTSWESSQASLAKRLDTEHWDTVAGAALELRVLDDMMRAAVAEGGPNAGATSIALSAAIVARFGSLRKDTMAAYEVLAGLAATPRSPDERQALDNSAPRTSP